MQAINCENGTEYLEALVLRGAGAAQSLHGLGYELGELGFLFPTGPADFSIKSGETNSGALTTSYSVASGSVAWSKSDRGVNMTTHFYLVPMSRIRGVMCLRRHSS
jgi:hypothetical protein